MKYSKEDILQAAFSEFMANGYDNATISNLQKRLNMSRGAMYRHYKNKDDLFKSVIDKYIFELFDRMLYKFSPDTKVLELIRIMYRRQKLIVILFNKSKVSHLTYLHFTDLLIQASKHYPGFLEQYKKIQKYIKDCWVTALKNSIKANEIRNDTNINLMSELIKNICLKDTRDEYDTDRDFVSNMMSGIEEKNELILYLYSLIKV